eukprot:8219153-Pyramimonas_sp.AAC.1
MEYGLGELTMDRRRIPPPRHNVPCLEQHFENGNRPRMQRSVSERQKASGNAASRGILQFKRIRIECAA